MSSFLWQGNLPNRASTIKRLLARHDIHLRRASVKLHLLAIVFNVVYLRWKVFKTYNIFGRSSQNYFVLASFCSLHSSQPF